MKNKWKPSKRMKRKLLRIFKGIPADLRFLRSSLLADERAGNNPVILPKRDYRYAWRCREFTLYVANMAAVDRSKSFTLPREKVAAIWGVAPAIICIWAQWLERDGLLIPVRKGGRSGPKKYVFDFDRFPPIR